MSDSQPPKPPIDLDNLEPHPVYDAPGCGLASYSCILLVFFLVGIAGIGLSTFSLFQSSIQRRPFSLVPGNQVKVWRLQPMRDAKLLEMTEIPLHYHDESKDGTTACAMSETAVLRLEDEKAWRIPYTAIKKVKQGREGGDLFATVSTIDEQSLRCYFEPGEGVERFVIYTREKVEAVNKP